MKTKIMKCYKVVVKIGKGLYSCVRYGKNDYLRVQYKVGKYVEPKPLAKKMGYLLCVFKDLKSAKNFTFLRRYNRIYEAIAHVKEKHKQTFITSGICFYSPLKGSRLPKNTHRHWEDYPSGTLFATKVKLLKRIQ